MIPKLLASRATYAASFVAGLVAAEFAAGKVHFTMALASAAILVACISTFCYLTKGE